MENQNAKCSSSKHPEVDAVSYCPECKKYLCDNCLNFHTELFGDHKTNKLTEIKEQINKDDLYDDYNIELKKPIHMLTNHTKIVFSLCLLNDGRLVSGSKDNSIIIYNKITYQPDIIIKEHNDGITYIT